MKNKKIALAVSAGIAAYKAVELLRMLMKCCQYPKSVTMFLMLKLLLTLKIGCLEEIAWRSGYIDVDRFKHLADGYPESSYGRYLKTLAQTALT